MKCIAKGCCHGYQPAKEDHTMAAVIAHSTKKRGAAVPEEKIKL
jgi:hypothetical protein